LAEATGDLPEGAIFVEEALQRAAQGDNEAGLLVMEKRGGAWHFVAVGRPDGEVVDDARVAPCAACHREAPRDFVFPAWAASPTSSK
jgi:hypothetical protein